MAEGSVHLASEYLGHATHQKRDESMHLAEMNMGEKGEKVNFINSDLKMV